MKGNIIGNSFNKFVKEQIKVRQKVYGSKERTPQQLSYLNGKQAFVRLISSVDIVGEEGTEKLKQFGFPNPEIYMGSQLAKDFILHAGTTLYDEFGVPTEESLRRGIDFTGDLLGDVNKAYGIGGTEFGLQPMPTLGDVDIKHRNRGSLREANLTIKCFNPKQFEIIDTLYLRLGYTLLLEWGNSTYFDNEGEYVNNNFYNSLQSYMFDEGNKDDQLKLLHRIIKLRSESSGNYDGFFGVVSNYDWTFDNGVYNISLKLMSLGAIAESLLIKSTAPKTTENGEGADTELAFLNTYKNHNNIATLLFEAASIPFDFDQGPVDEVTQEIINTADEEEDPNNNNYSDVLADMMLEAGNDGREGISKQDQIEVSTRSERKAVEISIKQEQDAIGTPPPQFFSLKKIAEAVGFSSDIEFGKISRTNKNTQQTTTADIPDSKLSIMRINRELTSSDGMSSTDPLVYIRFSALLEFLEKTQMIYNPNQKDNSSLMFIDYNINSNYMVCSELTISSSPSTVLVNVGEIINNEFYGLDESTQNYLKKTKSITTTALPQFKEKIGGKTAGKVMNIYLNAKYLVDLLILIQTEQNQIPVFGFLTSICKEINNSLGDIGSIIPFIDETTNTLKIIEEGVLPNKNEILKNKFNENTLEAPLELFGYNNFETTTPSAGFVKNFGIKTQITNDLMTTISIGAQAKGLNAEYDGTAFSNWNRGLIDRLVSIKDVEPKSSPPSQSLFEKYDTQLRGYKELLKLTEERFFSIPSAKSSLHGVLKFNQEYVIVNKEKPVTTPSFLPLNFNFTIDGMSGINIFNAFKANSRFLPYPFPESLEFTIMGVSHKISNNIWTTTVDSLSIPLSEDVKVDPESIPFVTPPAYEVILGAKAKALPSKTKENIRIIAKYLKDLGITRDGCVGFMGNILGESQANPAAIERKNEPIITGLGGIGIVQWTASRRRKLEKAANMDATKVRDLNFQLDYLKGELNRSYRTVFTQLKQSTSVQSSVIIVLEKFEIPGSYLKRKTNPAGYASTKRKRLGYANSAAPTIDEVYNA